MDEARKSDQGEPRHAAGMGDGALTLRFTSLYKRHAHQSRLFRPAARQMARIFGPVCVGRCGDNCDWPDCKKYGPIAGSMILALPVIFPATATLLEKHDRDKKRRAGIAWYLRKRHPWSLPRAQRL
jgi:hypothetical protein